MHTSPRTRFATLTLAAAALVSPLTAGAAQAAPPVVPEGVCVQEVAAMTQTRAEVTTDRTARREARAARDAAVAAYLAHPTRTHRRTMAAARIVLRAARADLLLGTSARGAARAALDDCAALAIPTVRLSNLHQEPWSGDQGHQLIGDVTVTGVSGSAFVLDVVWSQMRFNVDPSGTTVIRGLQLRVCAPGFEAPDSIVVQLDRPDTWTPFDYSTSAVIKEPCSV